MITGESIDRPKKCLKCSELLKKETAFECISCSGIYCRSHIRINPSSLSYFCFKCFTDHLNAEAISETSEEYDSATLTARKLKAKVLNMKKEIKDRAKVIERLEEMKGSNQKANQRKLEKIFQSITDEERAEENLSLTCDSLEPTIRDLQSNLTEELKRLEEIKEEHITIRIELDLLKQENVVMRSQIKEAHDLIKTVVPYSRLRNLSCKHCKNRIKDAFKQIIVLGNQNRMSILQSVLEFRLSNYSRVSTGNPKPKPEDSCKCTIQ